MLNNLTGQDEEFSAHVQAQLAWLGEQRVPDYQRLYNSLVAYFFATGLFKWHKYSDTPTTETSGKTLATFCFCWSFSYFATWPDSLPSTPSSVSTIWSSVLSTYRLLIDGVFRRVFSQNVTKFTPPPPLNLRPTCILQCRYEQRCTVSRGWESAMGPPVRPLYCEIFEKRPFIIVPALTVLLRENFFDFLIFCHILVQVTDNDIVWFQPIICYDFDL